MSRKFPFIFVFAVLLLELLGTSARDPPELTCNVTRQSDLSFKYELSGPPDYASCQTQWVDANKTSIVVNTSYADHIGKDVANQSVTLKHCVEYLHYIRDCLEGYQDAECRANCSLLSTEEPRPVTVNSTLTCISESWCLDQTTVIVFSVIVAVIVIIGFGIAVGFNRCKRRRRRISLREAVYRPANQEVKFHEITV